MTLDDREVSYQVTYSSDIHAQVHRNKISHVLIQSTHNYLEFKQLNTLM